MDWSAFGIAFGALAGGCVIRAFLPYIIGGLNAISENGWSAWPKFEAKYSFGLAVIGYGVLCLSPGVAEQLASMSPVAAVAIGYGGGTIIREELKSLFSGLR